MLNQHGLFADRFERQMVELRAAVDEHEPAAVARVAHKLKSSAAQFGLRGLSALLQEMEALGRSNSLVGGEALLARIEAEYEDGLEFLAAQGVGNVD